MSLRIGPHNATPAIGRARDAVQKTLEQLSSAKRITRAADDAAGLAIATQLNAAERAFAQGQRNLSDGISVARTADGALGEISSITTRMRELVVQAGNGTLDDNARAAIQREFDDLAEEVTRISEATEFNGQKLLNGDTQGAGAVTLRDGTGGNDVVQISIDEASAANLGVEGLDVSDASSLEAIDQALSKLSAERGKLGAVENRLEAGIRNLESIRENTAAARSRIEDADYAQAASERTRAQIMERAAIATQVQANLTSASVLDLLLNR